MRRDLAALAAQSFDLCVIGGGVVGTCVARDAARRGLSVALIEQLDFAAAASEAMSRTIHGGIRYLSGGKVKLVRTGLREQATWARIAAGFVERQDWIIPHYGRSRDLANRLGVALYQWLAGRAATHLSKGEAVIREPLLDIPALSGASIYQDYHLADPHRLVIAMLKDAATHGALLANHVRATGLLSNNGIVEGVSVQDHLTGDMFEIRAHQVVNATGPWAAKLATIMLSQQKSVEVVASKGIHIVVPAFTRNALALSGRGEHAFVIPWHGMSLIGTTDDPISGDPVEVKALPNDIRALQEKVARLLPAARPYLEPMLHQYAGVRALPRSGANTYQTSREEIIVHHAEDGMGGLWTITGGKWTTARLMAEHAVDRIGSFSGKALHACETAHVPLEPGTAHLAPDAARALATVEMAMDEADVARRMGRHICIGTVSGAANLQR